VNDLIRQFKIFYSDFNKMDLDRIGDIYSDNIIFRDPIHEIRGLANLQSYMTEMGENVSECRFEYLDVLASDGIAYIKWNMHFRHPKLSPEMISVRGVSQLNFDERIYFHEDVYDMGAMIYEHVPIIGFTTRFLKKRLAG